MGNGAKKERERGKKMREEGDKGRGKRKKEENFRNIKEER